MKTWLLFLSLSLMSSAHALTLKTHLHHLDVKKAVQCTEGVHPNGNNYPVPSVITLNEISLSIPHQNGVVFKLSNAKLGETCKALLEEFKAHKNEHGTIPVTVTVNHSKMEKTMHGTFATIDERGEVTGARGYDYDVLVEAINFSVGRLKFTGFSSFEVLKSVR